MRGTYTTYYMRLLIMGGYKFWAVTIILHKKILRLQFLGGYYYATVTITGITVIYFNTVFLKKEIMRDL